MSIPDPIQRLQDPPEPTEADWKEIERRAKGAENAAEDGLTYDDNGVDVPSMEAA